MLDQIPIFSGSVFSHQRRLFTRLDLGSVLQQWNDLCLQQFAGGIQDCDPDLLVERLHERFTCDPLRLNDDVRLDKTWPLSNGGQELEFSIGFAGEPVLWECSPFPIEEMLPEGCDFDDWFLAPGETLQRPYGEVHRDRLIVMVSEGLLDDKLGEIREIIEQQTGLVEQNNLVLRKRLNALVGKPHSLH